MTVKAAAFGVIALVMATAGCTPGPSAPSGIRYAVSAPLLVLRGRPVMACYGIELSPPPAGCGGVEVRDVRVPNVAGITTYANGTIQTPTFTLVGTWDGKALTLTETPESTSRSGTEPRPISQLPPSPAATAASPEQIAHDWAYLQARGIVVLSVGDGADGVDVILAVADVLSVETVYARHGPVHISGWLQPG